MRHIVKAVVRGAAGNCATRNPPTFERAKEAIQEASELAEEAITYGFQAVVYVSAQVAGKSPVLTHKIAVTELPESEPDARPWRAYGSGEEVVLLGTVYAPEEGVALGRAGFIFGEELRLRGLTSVYVEEGER